jgi:SAM-dependent methyltransferase
MKSIPLSNVASMIGVSSATVRNWVRAGYLTPAAQVPLCFFEEDAIRLRTKIVSGSLGRLRTRANKASSDSRAIPKEYSKQSESLPVIDAVVDTFKRERLDLGRTMFFAALRLLVLRGEVVRGPGSRIEDFESFHSWKREAIKAELAQWNATFGAVVHNRGYESVYSSFSSYDEDDLLGLLYQSLCNEGRKSDRGSYYTPSSVVDDALRRSGFTGTSFLDPCCGTGSYLLSAAKILNLRPEDIYGVDSDEIAARIARLNLLLAFPSHNAKPQIRCANTLTELATGEIFCDSNDLIGYFDFIATNPPWGAFKNSTTLTAYELGSNSNEAFSLFLIKSLTLLKEGGLLSFVLPQSILRIKTHSQIRKHVLTNAKIVRISQLGRVFTGVFTTAIRLDLIKGKATPEWRVAVDDSKGATSEIEQLRFASNVNYDFDVEVNEDEDQVLKNIYAVDHITLAGNATWALGVVTGDNKKYLFDTAQPGMEPIFRGSDVSPFELQNPQTFIHFIPSLFQQVAKEAIYRAPEKLIYKFISSSLVFAYDNKRSLTLNSANILIPALPGMSTKVALAFLNSLVFQYIYKKCATHKVLRGDLEKLPFPKVSQHECTQIETLVNAILAGIDESARLQELLFQIFQLSASDIKLIRTTMGGR